MEFSLKEKYGAADLIEIVRLLRAPGGCPWDREQTHASIRMNFIEETYEAAEAIDAGDPAMLEEELGDVLLQVALHAQMEAEAGRFTFDDVCDGICKKLIYRHPHVFGDVTADTSGQVLKNWDELKKKEKHHETAASDLEAVPTTLPGAMRAAKLQKRAAGYGLGWHEAQEALSAAAAAGEALCAAAEREARAQAAGRLLFAAVGAVRLAGVDAELALTRASETFTAAAAEAERRAEAKGGFSALSGPERDELWRGITKFP